MSRGPYTSNPKGRPAAQKDLLLDVSRLIWRSWRGKLPTGIDRVCLEYVAHFGSRAQAVVQYKGRTHVLAPGASGRLFTLLLSGGPAIRRKLIALALRAAALTKGKPPRPGMIYLNVGHTGLHDSSLTRWISKYEVRAIHLVHDLIPITHPQFCRAGEAQKHADRIRNALESATGIIGNSKATLDDLANFASTIGHPMPPILPARISGVQIPERIIPRKLARPYFIVIGTIEGRKNHLLLLKVWRRLVSALGDQAPILVLVGQRGWKAEETIAILDQLDDLDGHVLELSRCQDDELLELLAGATALLMPSLAEGFGLPVVEALQVGTPVIASDLPIFRELAGQIPTYLDPSDVDAWEAAIQAFIANGFERQRQGSLISGYQAPDWPGHFSAVEQWLGTLPHKVTGSVR
jgi:glycosyltransferase involved in cell wall biosynthesis